MKISEFTTNELALIIYKRADEKINESISENRFGVTMDVCEGIISGHPSYKEEFNVICVEGRWSAIETWQLAAKPDQWRHAVTDPRFEIQFPAMERM